MFVVMIYSGSEGISLQLPNDRDKDYWSENKDADKNEYDNVKDNDGYDANDINNVDSTSDANDMDVTDNASNVDNADDAEDKDAYDVNGGGNYNNGDNNEVEVFGDLSRGRNCWDTPQILFRYEIEIIGDSSRGRNCWDTSWILFRKELLLWKERYPIFNRSIIL